jgi:hypothetical protein
MTHAKLTGNLADHVFCVKLACSEEPELAFFGLS